MVRSFVGLLFHRDDVQQLLRIFRIKTSKPFSSLRCSIWHHMIIIWHPHQLSVSWLYIAVILGALLGPCTSPDRYAYWEPKQKVNLGVPRSIWDALFFLYQPVQRVSTFYMHFQAPATPAFRQQRGLVFGRMSIEI